MQNIKNIIFDYGNVIFLLDFQKLREGWESIAISGPDAFFSHGVQHPIFDQFDKGLISPAEFRNFIREKSGKEGITDEEIDAAWNSLLLGVDDGTHDILAELNKKYRTFLLSNINPIHYGYIMDYLKEEFGFENNDHLFEKTYYSHFVGLRKPDSAFFEKVLNENGLVPGETLFIDDIAANLEPAKALGIQTFLMQAPDTVQAFIKREGLL
ncbi:HAD family hydrolase [Mucilaginibacter ginsenosidivorans]|uniref:HAD family phosphatase n=1 Tax=Mucilaginibacter ginsenosidivorans TaxID=398053 RepID=A0A5B8UYU8_9SPHI|nr:HAD family phosphatase [Mucilaginibacter ginsenosidivorans]QEC63753.1 HAD family phosphatase [Mucilaginibacter ginsenosidivorans]